MIQPANARIPRENEHSDKCAAPGAALEVENAAIDADLQSIVDAWPNLPEALKAGILAMVKAQSEMA